MRIQHFYGFSGKVFVNVMKVVLKGMSVLSESPVPCIVCFL